MMNCLHILTITVLTTLGTAAVVRIVIDAINHYGGHHEE